METASSPDLGSGFETPQVPKTCELVCIVMEIPSSPRFPRAVKCGNPWFHQGRDVETPSFPGLGVTWKTPSPRRLGRRRLRSWRDMETASFPRPGRRGVTWKPPVFPGLGAAGFGRGATRKPQVSQGWAPPVSVGARRGNPKFPPAWARHRNPKFPQAWARLVNPKKICAGRKPQILGAAWEPHILAPHGNPKFWAPHGNPKLWAPHGNPKLWASGGNPKFSAPHGNPKLGRRLETPHFGRRRLETPHFGAAWKPQILGAAWKPQMLGAAWKPQLSRASAPFPSRCGNPKFPAPKQ